MKYFRITPGKDGTRITYPINYQHEVGDKAVDHLYYDEQGKLYLLLLIPDKDAVGIIRSGVEELTETEATAISTQHETRIEKITDPAKIERIKIKISLAQTLTSEDLKALDPEDPTLGFGKEQILADRISVQKVNEAFL